MSEHTTEEHPPFTPLLAAIFTQMANDTASTTNSLLDSYKHEADRAKAELQLVRKRISELLLDSPYKPTSHALIEALYPARALVEAEIDADKEN